MSKPGVHANEIVLSCIVLHNLCIRFGGYGEQFFEKFEAFFIQNERAMRTLIRSIDERIEEIEEEAPFVLQNANAAHEMRAAVALYVKAARECNKESFEAGENVRMYGRSYQ